MALTTLAGTTLFFLVVWLILGFLYTRLENHFIEKKKLSEGWTYVNGVWHEPDPLFTQTMYMEAGGWE